MYLDILTEIVTTLSKEIAAFADRLVADSSQYLYILRRVGHLNFLVHLIAEQAIPDMLQLQAIVVESILGTPAAVYWASATEIMFFICDTDLVALPFYWAALDLHDRVNAA
jgi:hypothetical protein